MVAVELERGRVVHHAQERRPDRADGLLPGACGLRALISIAIDGRANQCAYPALVITDWNRDLHESTTRHVHGPGGLEDPG